MLRTVKIDIKGCLDAYEFETKFILFSSIWSKMTTK